MIIKFIPLAELHFSLLLKWLNTSHVKSWWDRDVNWTLLQGYPWSTYTLDDKK